MPIVAGNDASAVAILEAAVSERASGMAFGTSNLREANVGNLSHTSPYRLMLLTADSIRRGFKLRGKATEMGWRFFIHGADGVIAAATVLKKEDGPYEFSGFSEGPRVTATDQAIHYAQALQEVRNGQFEILLLQIPELHIAAVWLSDLDGPSDGRGDYIVRQVGELMTDSPC